MKHDDERYISAEEAWQEAERRMQKLLRRAEDCRCMPPLVARYYLRRGLCVLCGGLTK